jgi:hypothetical protein
MAAKILVPLKKHDRVEEIVPFIEKVAQPGTRVIFLVRHPVNGLKWLQAYSAISQCGIESAPPVRKMAESYSARMRMQLGRQKVFNTSEALHKLDVRVGVDVYAGSLSKTLRSYENNEDGQLVLIQPSIRQRIVSFLQGTVSLRRLFSRRSFSSVILLHGAA